MSRSFLIWNCCFCLIFILLLPLKGRSQTPDPDTSDAAEAAAQNEASGVWDSMIKGRISGSQSGYHNWQEGGSSTLSLMTELIGEAERETEDWKQRQSFRLAFGTEKQGGLAFRKAQDLIQYGFALQYEGNSNLDPTVSAEFRTQFAPGYDYNNGEKPPVKVSDIFSPAYIKQKIGFTYDPNEWLRTTLGLAGKETIVLIDRLRPEEGQSVRVEMGMDLTTNVDKEIFDNVRLDSELSLFAAFNNSSFPDMRWENRIIMQVNKWISVDIEAVAYYDRDVSSELQFRENISLGVFYNFL